MSQHTGAAKRTVDLTPKNPKPIVTILMICLMPLALSNGKIDWIENTGLSPAHFAELLATGQHVNLLQNMGTATFAQLTQWLWVPNAMFVWIFGHVLEQKLKGWRYAAFILLSIVATWTAVYVTAGFNYNSHFIGPSMLLFAMLGGYFVFLPKKPFEPRQWVRPSTEIFRNEKPPQTREAYWVSPWVFVTAFIIYQVVLQVGLTFSAESLASQFNQPMLEQLHKALLGRMQVQVLAYTPITALISVAIGAALAVALPILAISAKPTRPGGKLQVEVIRHYQELRTLDLTHEQACEGAAKFAAVPIEIARDWIKKGAAGLKDQQIN